MQLTIGATGVTVEVRGIGPVQVPVQTADKKEGK